MKALLVILLIIIGLIIGIGIFAFQSWLLMLAWNFLAGYFGFQTITFTISMVIVFLLGLVGGFFKTTVKKD